MGYKTLELDKIRKEYNRYTLELTINNSLDPNHQRIRQFFIDNYYKLKKEYIDNPYSFDVELGLLFYEFLNGEQDFNHLYSASYDFWRYIAVYDIPDIIADRFGINAIDHFYKKSTRVYPYVIYWYINLSWQGNIESTREILKNNSTDEILQVVERTNKIGINLDFYRALLKEYSNSKYDVLKKEVLQKAKEEKKTQTLFRIILTKNTSKLLVFRPEFYPGGIKEYIKMLFDIRSN